MSTTCGVFRPRTIFVGISETHCPGGKIKTIDANHVVLPPLHIIWWEGSDCLDKTERPNNIQGRYGCRNSRPIVVGSSQVVICHSQFACISSSKPRRIYPAPVTD